MKRGLAVVFGLLFVLLAAAAGTVGGLALNLFNAEGRYELPVAQLDTPGAAIYVSAFNLEPIVVPEGLLTTELEFEGAAGRSVFIGTGSANDIQPFLSGVPYDAVAQISDQEVVANPVPGSVLPAPEPTGADFWTESASGPIAAIEWDQSMSQEILVLMNSDGSAGVAGDLRGVLSADWVRGAAIGAVAAAAVFLVLGLWLLIRGGRRRAPADD